MKRLLLFLLVALMLSGCTRQPPAQPTESTPPPTEGVNELYAENSSMEQQTGGAVLTYELPDTYFGLSSMGANLLVAGQNGLLVLAGERGEVVASLDTTDLSPDSVMDTAATGMAYYLPDERQVVVRNPMLQSSTQVQMPENMVGEPVISLIKNEIFYSVGNEIRAMNITTGISRLIRQRSTATQMLLSDYFDGSMLRCVYAEGENDSQSEYISSETGAVLRENANDCTLFTRGNKFIGYWQDGSLLMSVFGTRGETAYRFLGENPQEDGSGQVALPAKNAVVNYKVTDSGLTLDFYDLQSGKRTAQVSLPGEKEPTKIYSSGTYIWILSGNMLYRWDVAKSPAQDETVYTGPLYTAQQPDTEGLAQCQAMADAMSAQYGVKLLIWQNAVQKTGGYTVTAEHQTQVITAMLEQLQPVLAYFPEKFLQKTVEKGWIRIALVRSIEESADCVQFWEDGDSWILLPLQSKTSVLEKMSYAIVSHVRGNSRDLDEDRWIPLNPKEFVYTGNNSALEKPEYLEGENRAFTDRLAMSYPHEDQSRMLYYAMVADNEEMFRSSVMQAKLLRLCMGIREAYGLQKNTNTFVWEQYLQTSLAYVKK